jgi:hypothetical protein
MIKFTQTVIQEEEERGSNVSIFLHLFLISTSVLILTNSSFLLYYLAYYHLVQGLGIVQFR